MQNEADVNQLEKTIIMIEEKLKAQFAESTRSLLLLHSWFN